MTGLGETSVSHLLLVLFLFFIFGICLVLLMEITDEYDLLDRVCRSWETNGLNGFADFQRPHFLLLFSLASSRYSCTCSRVSMGPFIMFSLLVDFQGRIGMFAFHYRSWNRNSLQRRLAHGTPMRVEWRQWRCQVRAVGGGISDCRRRLGCLGYRRAASEGAGY
jgi:hypothetical protein